MPHAENVRTDIDHKNSLLAATKAAYDRRGAINVVDLQAFAVTGNRAHTVNGREDFHR